MERVPEGVDILVLPGVPGTSSASADSGRYPSVASDVVKILREQQLVVEYAQPKEQRIQDVRKGAELWIPVLLFAQTVLAGAAGNLLAMLIFELAGGEEKVPSTTLHVKCGFETAGEAEWFEAHGDATDVLEALQEFNRDRE